MEKGKLIVIEGTDGSGKATQGKMLFNRLEDEKIPYAYLSFPQYDTPTGEIIKKYLSGGFGNPSTVEPKFAATLYALDRLAASEKIKELLNQGKNLILDRYYQSNITYQTAKAESTSEKEEISNFIEKLELGLYKIPREDKVLFLYTPTEVASELIRRSGKEIDGHEENLIYLKKVEDAYLHLAKNNNNWIKFNCVPDGTIDSLKTPEEIHEEVYRYIKTL